MEYNLLKIFQEYAIENGFELKLGRWDFVYNQGRKRLTLPVEMLTHGEFLWEFSRTSIKAWDAPLDQEVIDDEAAARIIERIVRFVELTGKRVRVY